MKVKVQQQYLTRFSKGVMAGTDSTVVTPMVSRNELKPENMIYPTNMIVFNSNMTNFHIQKLSNSISRAA